MPRMGSTHGIIFSKRPPKNAVNITIQMVLAWVDSRTGTDDSLMLRGWPLTYNSPVIGVVGVFINGTRSWPFLKVCFAISKVWVLVGKKDAVAVLSGKASNIMASWVIHKFGMGGIAGGGSLGKLVGIFSLMVAVLGTQTSSHSSQSNVADIRAVFCLM